MVLFMMKALKPFWIYWGLLTTGCILFYSIPMMSLLLFLILPVMLVIIPVWFVIVYLIGDAVSLKGSFDKIIQRIGISLLCTFLTVIPFPVVSWICDSMTWDHFYLTSLIGNFNDRPLWIVFAIHFFAFWIGEEMGHLAVKAEKEGHNKPENEEQH